MHVARLDGVRTLHLQIIDGVKTTTLVFTRFPVRIGREAPSECVLELAFVSKLHARLDLKDERLVLCDEGSRNGTYVRNRAERLRPSELVALADVENEFQIGTLRLRATLIGDSARVVDPNRTTESRDEPVDDEKATRNYALDGIEPGLVDARAARTQLTLPLERYRRARAELHEALRVGGETMEPSRLAALLVDVARDCPELVLPVDIAAIVERASQPPASSRDADLALAGLRELAGSYVPYAPPLEGVDAVVAFIERLDSALGFLVEAFAALRFAYRHERGLAAGDDEAPRGVEFGAPLLDWTRPPNEGRETIEREFVAIVRHHAKLADEVTRGAERVLGELSPRAIEEALDRARAEGSAGLSVGPFRWRALWRLYRARYAQLAPHDRGSATAIFGPAFGLLCGALDPSPHTPTAPTAESFSGAAEEAPHATPPLPSMAHA
jgi:hypothetical protein